VRLGWMLIASLLLVGTTVGGNKLTVQQSGNELRLVLSNEDVVGGLQMRVSVSSSVSLGNITQGRRTLGWIVAGHMINDTTMSVVIISSTDDQLPSGTGEVAVIPFSGSGFVGLADVVLGSPDAQGLDVSTEGTWLRDDSTPSITLEQNFPNPFNPSTQLRYTVRKPGHVRLAIYDITGREVSVLADAEVAPGTFSANWVAQHNGATLASGTYFARLSMGGEVKVTRMVLAR